MAKVSSNIVRLRIHERIRKRLAGSPARPRLAVFRSNKHIYAQIIDDSKGSTLTAASSRDVDAKKDLQLSIYAIAAKEILELNPVRLAFHYLQDNSVQVTTRDKKQLDQVQKIVQETAADIRAPD